jgi:hydrogenase-1 operon protein HyaE
MPLHPLLARLVETAGATLVTPQTVEAFESLPGDGVLLFSGDPVRFPEALDLAVVLPELHAAHGRAFRIGVVAREGEDEVARRWSVLRWPSLVFMRDGQYLATLSGMKDWDVFVAEVGQALRAQPTRRPGVGIPVVSADASRGCH